MVHTSVGTANAVCGVFNAATDRIAILLAAGRTPLFEDSVLGSRDGVQVAAVLDRALDLALTAPRGPVHLSLPREVLARDASGAVPARGHRDPDRRRPRPRGAPPAR